MFNWLKKIKNPFRSFNHNPEDFQVKLEPMTSIGFEDNFYVMYTANGGIKWEYVYCAQSPFLDMLDRNWEWKKWCGSLNNNGPEFVKRNFNSYQSILSFEAIESERLNKGRKEHQKKIDEHQKKIKDKYKSFEI